MTKNKIPNILIFILSIALVLYTLLWGVVNFIIIPKILIPKVSEYISLNLKGPVKIDIGKISFSPFSGFVLYDVKFTGPLFVDRSNILQARLIDVDLKLLPIAWKRIEIKKLNIFDARINIARDKSGAWNFTPLLQMDFFSEKNIDMGFIFLIKEFKLKRCSIDYLDCFKNDNTLRRNFPNADLSITSPRNNYYNIVLSASSSDKSEEEVGLVMNYDVANTMLNGRIRANTKHLKEYWYYYLDDILKPWLLKAEDVSIDMQLSSYKDILLLDGLYAINGGVLSYGDLNINGNCIIKHRQRYAKSDSMGNFSRIDLYVQDLLAKGGEHVILKKGKCNLVISEKTILIKKIQGVILGQGLFLSGSFGFDYPRELYLEGRIGRLDNVLTFKFSEDNQASLDLRGKAGNSYFKLNANSNDFKSLVFDSNIDGSIDLSDIRSLSLKDKEGFKGKVVFSGSIKGELDKASSLNGKLNVDMEDLTIFDLKPQTLVLTADVIGGILEGRIEETDFFRGKLYGFVKFDFDRWGVELHIDKLKVEDFLEPDPKLSGITGIFSGNIACMGKYIDLNSVEGGGYIKLTECSLRKMSMFSSAEDGIKSIVKGFIMPNFKSIEGNFQIKEKNINVENALCSAPTLNLTINGTCSFSGMTDFTLGVMFLGENFLRTARQIFLPYTIGLDFLANCIKVKINGKWPDLKQKTKIEPIGWLKIFFAKEKAPKPGKYTLLELWP